MESLCVIGVNRSYHGANGSWSSLLFNDGVSLICIYQGRGDRHTCRMVSSKRLPPNQVTIRRTDRRRHRKPLREDHSGIRVGYARGCGCRDRGTLQEVQRDRVVNGQHPKRKVFRMCHSDGFGSIHPMPRNARYAFLHRHQRPTVASTTRTETTVAGCAIRSQSLG